MADNPLSPATLLSLIEGSLWTPSSESSSTRPQTLRNPYDAIALFAHACMLSVGFRLVGLDEDDRLGRFNGFRSSHIVFLIWRFGLLTLGISGRYTHRCIQREILTTEVELWKLLLISLCPSTVLARVFD